MIYAESPFWLTNQPSVDRETKQIEMSFRTGVPKPSEALTASDLQIGQKVDGVIKRIEDYGLFIQIDGSKLSGLCHKSQVCVFPIFRHIF
jgi:rRNA biogenesis protein RRP5